MPYGSEFDPTLKYRFISKKNCQTKMFYITRYFIFSYENVYKLKFSIFWLRLNRFVIEECVIALNAHLYSSVILCQWPRIFFVYDNVRDVSKSL